MRWHGDIVRRRWARLSRQGRSGRPATRRNVRSLVLRLARENESWGLPPDPRRAGRARHQRGAIDSVADTQVKFVLHDRDASLTAAFDAVFQAAGARTVRSAIQAPRMTSIMERWVGSCRRELLDRTLIWNQRHLMTVLREYEDFYNTHRPHRTLNQAAPLRPLPDGLTDLDHFRVRRRDRAGGVIHEYRLVA
ncbi:MAG: transposase [Pseudonocardia sp.]|nr:transposase [Pseudonocardia sp.]